MGRPAPLRPWCWLDTETTGLSPHEDPRTNAPCAPGLGARVVQVAVKVTDNALNPWQRGGRTAFFSRIKLPEADLLRASPKALEVNRYDAADYADAPPPEEVWPIVHAMLSGSHLVCQNIAFDRPFVINELRQLGLTYPADRRGIEIMGHSNLVAQQLGLTTWGLEAVYNALRERYSLAALAAHEALGDVDRMMAVYRHARTCYQRGARLGNHPDEVTALEIECDRLAGLLAERDGELATALAELEGQR